MILRMLSRRSRKALLLLWRRLTARGLIWKQRQSGLRLPDRAGFRYLGNIEDVSPRPSSRRAGGLPRSRPSAPQPVPHRSDALQELSRFPKNLNTVLSLKRMGQHLCCVSAYLVREHTLRTASLLRFCPVRRRMRSRKWEHATHDHRHVLGDARLDSDCL